MKATILITSFKRPQYLRWHLESLFDTKNTLVKECRILILNDGIEDGTERVAKDFQVDYLFTGQRNVEEMYWRVPGYAFNIGIQRCETETVILTCAEMFHLNNSLDEILVPVIDYEWALGTPIVYDDHGPLKEALEQATLISLEDPIREVKEQTAIRYKSQDPLLANEFMPYFLAVRRQRLLDIGGYDEDFTGIGADDNDIMDRLQASGCQYTYTRGEVVHLYHGATDFGSLEKDKRYQHNVRLWKDRKGQIKRNVGREWGVL